MNNHFKTALNDAEMMAKFEDKPVHKATLAALAAYVEKGNDLLDLPWFKITKDAKNRTQVRK